MRFKLLLAAMFGILASLATLALLARPEPSAVRSSAAPAVVSTKPPASGETTPVPAQAPETQASDDASRAPAQRRGRAQRTAARSELFHYLRSLPALKQCAAMHPAVFGGAVLTLELLALGDSTRIEDATALAPGTARPEMLACAEQALRGRELSLAVARPGRRYRMAFPLDDDYGQVIPTPPGSTTP